MRAVARDGTKTPRWKSSLGLTTATVVVPRMPLGLARWGAPHKPDRILVAHVSPQRLGSAICLFEPPPPTSNIRPLNCDRRELADKHRPSHVVRGGDVRRIALRSRFRSLELDDL